MERVTASLFGVLIVPCGMETKFFLTLFFAFSFVLIVPCGMETVYGYYQGLKAAEY